jgi:hypothetical protein
MKSLGFFFSPGTETNHRLAWVNLLYPRRPSGVGQFFLLILFFFLFFVAASCQREARGGKEREREKCWGRGTGRRSKEKTLKIVTWLILPVVICLSQRLSHACLSINNFVL